MQTTQAIGQNNCFPPKQNPARQTPEELHENPRQIELSKCSVLKLHFAAVHRLLQICYMLKMLYSSYSNFLIVLDLMHFDSFKDLVARKCIFNSAMSFYH